MLSKNCAAYPTAAGSGRNEDLEEMSRVAETQRPTVVGAAPEGAGDPRSAARAVREMFTSIAPRYDLLNHVLSCNVDRLWWRRTARTFAHIFAQPDCRILDFAAAPAT